MKVPLRIRRLAELEVNRAVIWYEERRAGLGVEFLSEIRKAMQKVAERPASFPIDYRHARKALVDRFPYKIYFVLKPDHVAIVGVLHASQSTANLRGRLNP